MPTDKELTELSTESCAQGQARTVAEAFAAEGVPTLPWRYELPDGGHLIVNRPVTLPDSVPYVDCTVTAEQYLAVFRQHANLVRASRATVPWSKAEGPYDVEAAQERERIVRIIAESRKRAEAAFDSLPKEGDPLDPDVGYIRLRHGRLLPIRG